MGNAPERSLLFARGPAARVSVESRGDAACIPGVRQGVPIMLPVVAAAAGSSDTVVDARARDRAGELGLREHEDDDTAG